MTAITHKSYKLAASSCLALALAGASLSVCRAQGVVDGKLLDPEYVPAAEVQKSSAPTLSEWQSSYDKMNAALPAASSDVAFQETDVSQKPGDGLGAAPQISPEPSTIGLLLGSAVAVLRFGRRKRSR
jgi:hypothetical protein